MPGTRHLCGLPPAEPCPSCDICAGCHPPNHAPGSSGHRQLQPVRRSGGLCNLSPANLFPGVSADYVHWGCARLAVGICAGYHPPNHARHATSVRVTTRRTMPVMRHLCGLPPAEPCPARCICAGYHPPNHARHGASVRITTRRTMPGTRHLCGLPPAEPCPARGTSADCHPPTTTATSMATDGCRHPFNPSRGDVATHPTSHIPPVERSPYFFGG